MFLLGSFFVWLKQLLINKGCDRRHILFALVITFSRLLMFFPRLIERIFLGYVIKSTKIDKAPIFIIGHWRSGTTFLHNLMTQDKNLGFLTTVQALAPEMFFFFGKIIKKVLARRMPSVRPMDDIPMSPDAPQEEEFAVANMSMFSFYHMWVFPKKAQYYFEKYALLNNNSNQQLEGWKKTYLNLLKKITMNAGGRRLILKNPVNTGRIRLLLELFPGAKFIYLYRNPFVVFPSTIHLYDKMIEMCGVQDILKKEMEENILLFYEKLIKKYISEKELIPQGNLVEIKFEELEADPLINLRHVYEELNLPGFEQAAPLFSNYIASMGSYRKNQYAVDDDVVRKVRGKWQFTINEFKYDHPEEIPLFPRMQEDQEQSDNAKQEGLFQ